MSSLEDVRNGMDVVDSRGQQVGTVRFVKMGNPQATTPDGQTIGDHRNVIDVVADAFRGKDDMPAETQERLLRLGYIDVDGTGIGESFSVGADEVANVTGTTVQLNTRRGDI